ncbi:MAG: hypothetical protein FJZ90_13735 [Chloroflexi bacterium]|nr:hypothetical protein [Chloroflexota bacterium]
MPTRDPVTEALRVRIYRAMTPEQRIAIAARLFEDGVAISACRLSRVTLWGAHTRHARAL